MAPPINVQDWYGDRHTCQIAPGALGIMSFHQFELHFNVALSTFRYNV